MTTTWTTNGKKHIARKGKLSIGRVLELQCETDEPFLAISENGMTKQFLLLFHAKEWIEDLAIGIDEADFFE